MAEHEVHQADDRAAVRLNWKIQLLRVAVAITAIAIPVSSLLGFITLSSYLTNNLLITGLVLGGFVIFHGLVREVLTIALERGEDRRVEPGETEEPQDSSGSLLRFWLVAASLALLVGGISCGRIEQDEPLDLEEAAAEEERFWSETWDEPEPL